MPTLAALEADILDLGTPARGKGLQRPNAAGDVKDAVKQTTK
jgi:hypothetical protein